MFYRRKGCNLSPIDIWLGDQQDTAYRWWPRLPLDCECLVWVLSYFSIGAIEEAWGVKQFCTQQQINSFKTEVPENHKQFNSSTKLQTTKYLLYRVHWGKDSSAWRWPGEVWKARREQATFATALVFILIEESDMLTNKVMDVLHYEPDTKASQVCAFKSQPGQDTPSQDLPTRH